MHFLDNYNLKDLDTHTLHASIYGVKFLEWYEEIIIWAMDIKKEIFLASWVYTCGFKIVINYRKIQYYIGCQ